MAAGRRRKAKGAISLNRLLQGSVDAVREPSKRGQRARLWLIVVLVWPLVVYWCRSGWAWSSEAMVEAKVSSLVSYMEGSDPKHPRAAIVLVGSDPQRIVRAVESVFKTLDRNRLFVICILADTSSSSENSERSRWKKEMAGMDEGSSMHWHGLVPHMGHLQEPSLDLPHKHHKKIHIIDIPLHTLGTPAARNEGVQYVQLLARKEEQLGLKNPNEDLILVFINQNAQITTNRWIHALTDALILTPSHAHTHTHQHTDNNSTAKPKHELHIPPAQKLANAVTFAVDTQHHNTHDLPTTTTTTTPLNNNKRNQNKHAKVPATRKHKQIQKTIPFTYGTIRHLTPDFTVVTSKLFHNNHKHQHDDDDDEPYPTPLPLPAVTALRLQTYLDLPASDITALQNDVDADVQFSFNLWMCADGIDVLPNLRATLHQGEDDDEQQQDTGQRNILTTTTTTTTHVAAARLASAWMDEPYQNFIFHSMDQTHAKLQQQQQNNNDDAAADQSIFPYLTKIAKVASASSSHTLFHNHDNNNNDSSSASLSNTFPSNLKLKCRTFSWYVSNVSPSLSLPKHQQDENEKAFNKNQKLNYNNNQNNNKQNKQKKKKRAPSTPLSLENMSIIKRATQYNLHYIDVYSSNYDTHPHKGAMDELGQPNYVHDVTALHSDPPLFPFHQKSMCGENNDHDNDVKLLKEKIFVDSVAYEAMERMHNNNGGGGGGGSSGFKRVRLMCIVYTIEKNHYKIPAIRETWGQRCDGFLVASTKTDRTIDAVNIPHEGPEEYDNIYQKVRSIWSYVYDNYFDQFDYFHIGGDDYYLLVDNLKLYLESPEIRAASNGGLYLPDENDMERMQTPLFLGRRYAEYGKTELMFNSGGSGYTFNKAALKALVVDAFPNCFPHMHAAAEDVIIATCLRKLEIWPYDTKDEKGGERYMPFNPGHHLTYYPPADVNSDWYAKYSVPLGVKWGIDHCAAKAIAFHYINSDLMRRMHAILYHYCGV